MTTTPPEGELPEREDTLIDETVVYEPEVVAETEIVPPLPPPGAPLLPPDPERGNRIGYGMLVGLLLLGIAGAILAAVLFLGDDDDEQATTRAGATTVVVTRTNVTTAPPAQIAVPDVVGQSSDDATAALEGAGFQVNTANVPGPPPAGQVLAQSPTPGEQLERGSAIRINLSDGSQQAGTNTQATTQAATTATTEATTPEPATTSSTPTTTAAQPTSASVPELSGDVRAAAQRLAQVGLLASVAYVPAETPLGTFVAQNPDPGTTTPAGSRVTVNVSSGPGEKAQKTVPDTTGQTVNEALQTLNGAGLRLIMLRREVTDRADGGKIVEQTPAAGASAPENAQVIVYMGAFRG